MANDDRVCPSCSDQLALVLVGAERDDRWRLEHRSGRNCAWTVANGFATVPMPLATAKSVTFSSRGGVGRAGAMGAVGSSTASTGGSLVPATYGYKVAAVTAFGEGLPSAEKTQVVGAGTSTNTVPLTWSAVAAGINNPVVGYRVYGRTSGGPWQRLAQVSALTYTDTGADTPNPALVPSTTDTTDGG